MEAAKKFKRLKEILATDERNANATVYQPLVEYILSLHTQFLNENLVVWNEFIVWEERTLPDDTKKVTLLINNVDGKSDVIGVLLCYDYLDFEVKLLSRKLYDKLLEPIMNHEKYKTDVKVYSNDGMAEITVQFREEQDYGRNFKCQQTVRDLTQVFGILFESLDVFITEDETFVNKLAELLESQFCDCFVKYCVYGAIPTKLENVDELEETLQTVHDFDAFLKENGTAHEFLHSHSD